MKILFKKLKHANRFLLILFIITFLAYFVSYCFLFKNLASLSGIETAIRIFVMLLFGIWILVYFLWNLINLILKKHVKIIITSLITIIFTVIFFIGSYYINFIYSSIGNLSDSEYVTYTTNLIVFDDTEINENSHLGMINSTDDIEGNVLAKELIANKHLENLTVDNYSSYYEMINDLLNNKIDGIFLTNNYMAIFGEEEAFKDLKKTKVAYSYSKKMINQDTSIASNKSLKEPFTILLMGVDSEGDGLDANAAFNGDTLMLITFNPKTLNATMFSIPRDTYVPIACNNNRYAKINSSAAYGTNCVINTIKQLTDIDIDYYVKVNFKAVVDLVEALGGIDVEVEPPNYSVYKKTYGGRICEQNSLRQFGDNLVCMDTGMQHLNGEQALAYARCRHAYLQSDISRNKHQQQIIEAMASKLLNASNINKMEELLNSVTNNIATNMSTKQILSFYDVIKSMVINSINEGEFVNINKTYLEYYNLAVRVSQNGIFTSAIGYYPDSLNAIVKLMKENLELEEHETVKTFSFDANEDYSKKPTGQGITTGGKLETMPNFIGKGINEVETWAQAKNIILTKEFVDSDNEHYNSNIPAGLVANQSVNNGVLVNQITELTIYINNTAPIAPITPTEDDNSSNDEVVESNNPLEDILPNEN